LEEVVEMSEQATCPKCGAELPDDPVRRVTLQPLDGRAQEYCLDCVSPAVRQAIGHALMKGEELPRVSVDDQERDWALDLDGRYSGQAATLDELRRARANTSDPKQLSYIDALICDCDETGGDA
jgi:hypothetical protein